jgi:hypothetical protein
MAFCPAYLEESAPADVKRTVMRLLWQGLRSWKVLAIPTAAAAASITLNV